MLIIAYGGQYLTSRIRGFARFTHVLQRAFGTAVLVVAIAFYAQYDTVITVWLSNHNPNLQMGL
jgi:cytochrome c-type biogenesis protein